MPTLKEGGKIVPKLILDFYKEEVGKLANNYRTLNILFCGLKSNEFSHKSACDTTKEV